MAASLKSSTNLRVGVFLVANAVVFASTFLRSEISAVTVSEPSGALGQLLPAGLALLLVSVVNGLVPSDMKAQIVFWRLRNPLPGSEAFTRYAKTDPRVNMQSLWSRFGSLPTEAKAQNTLWYQLLRETEGVPAVDEAHRQYLLLRDVCVVALLLAFTLGLAAFFMAASSQTAIIYNGFLLGQYLLTRFAAVNYGRRFVCTVLAVSSTSTGAKGG